jgi:hypothetical protein
MSEPAGRTVDLLGFVALLEREPSEGTTYLRIDEATVPGQARRAHALLEERLATQEPFAGAWAPGRVLRVQGLMHDVDGHVLRVRVGVE